MSQADAAARSILVCMVGQLVTVMSNIASRGETISIETEEQLECRQNETNMSSVLRQGPGSPLPVSQLGRQLKRKAEDVATSFPRETFEGISLVSLTLVFPPFKRSRLSSNISAMGRQTWSNFMSTEEMRETYGPTCLSRDELYCSTDTQAEILKAQNLNQQLQLSVQDQCNLNYQCQASLATLQLKAMEIHEDLAVIQRNVIKLQKNIYSQVDGDPVDSDNSDSERGIIYFCQ